MFHCPVGVWVIEQRAIILSATVRSPTVNIGIHIIKMIWFHDHLICIMWIPFSLTGKRVSILKGPQVPQWNPYCVVLCNLQYSTWLQWLGFQQYASSKQWQGRLGQSQHRLLHSHNLMAVRHGLYRSVYHKSQNAPVPHPTMLHSVSEQKCAHFCSEWSIVGCGTDLCILGFVN